MIFSVFDPHRRCFDYYEAPGTAVNYGARGTKYRPLSGKPDLSGPVNGERLVVGYAAESLAMPLPQGARRVGSGNQARGLMAVVRGGARAGYGGGVSGSGGLAGVDVGDTGEPFPPPPVAPGGVTFGQAIAASCVAAVVGVFVQKLLKDK